MNIILFTNIPSPFMLELAEEINQFEGISYYIAFCEDSLQDRGQHWIDNKNSSSHIFFYNKGEIIKHWFDLILEKVNPDIIITGYNTGEIFDLIYLNKLKFGYKFGKWNEQPPLFESNFIRRKLRQIYLKNYWKNKIDFLLAIGNSAVNDFMEYIDDSLKIYFFPYQQKVEYIEEPKIISDPLVFLFSGRLIKRNNIINLTKAFYKLYLEYPNRFKWIISASGPEKSYIMNKMNDVEFSKHIEFDIEFKKWNDRLRPFKKSDVLVVPAFHSGWGLVVNEALALGLPVISTKKVACADYLIEHMINGIFVTTTTKSIYNALEYCLLNTNEVQRMSQNTLFIRNNYNVKKGAKQLYYILKNINTSLDFGKKNT